MCRETAPDSKIFERKFAKVTVRLDCNSWEASFVQEDNAPEVGDNGGYGGRGMSLPPAH